MQTPSSTSRRRHRKKSDVLDQKWLTYLLVFILILSIAVFVVLSSPKYKKQITEFVKGLFHKEKKVPRPRPGLGAEVGGFGNAGIANVRFLKNHASI